MKYIKERTDDYDAGFFVNELADAAKKLGILEAKISGYKFNSILVPMLRKKEVISSLQIEGTQTTVTDIFEKEICADTDDEIMQETVNLTKALVFGSEYLQTDSFSNSFIQQIHRLLMPEGSKESGKYKTADNFIVNSMGNVVFAPPSYSETKRYMDELLNYMNNTHDNINPLIKAAIIHSQFESIHPFSDGNGRIGRVLISLYLFRTQVINFPFFYMSEAINSEKTVYYSKLTDSRVNSYNEWIRFFLGKVAVQAEKHINYIDSMNILHEKVKAAVRESINSPKYDSIITCLFTHPVLSTGYLANYLNVSCTQAKHYLNVLEKQHILFGDDKKRYRKYFFLELLELARRN